MLEIAALEATLEVCRDDRAALGWYGRAYCKPENKVALGFVEDLNNKIRLMQRRVYGFRDQEYLLLKVLTSMLPQI